MSVVTRLIYARRNRFLRRPVRELLALYGVEFPPRAEVGPGLVVEHRGFGLVVSGLAKFGANVRLFQGVTIGEAQVGDRDSMAGVTIEDDVIIGAGAKVLGGDTVLTVHRGCIIAANAVLLTSTTGPGEVWAGIPARRVKLRASPS